MQAKLHRWAVADPGRRFDDLFNFVHDPATLIVAFSRVATNQGANTPGIDGLTAAWVEEQVGVPGFLDDLRAALKDGSSRPLPVRERLIPKPGGSFGWDGPSPPRRPLPEWHARGLGFESP
jgi:RNA-directed DNA polymerase